MNEITPKKPTELLDPQSQQIVQFLETIGVPSENVIADFENRQKIGMNLEAAISAIPAEKRQEARYLSKFIVGAGYGLFDYSLNAIWNEVVITLRKKAAVYGLDIFFDAAVGGSKNREFYQTEDDLSSIKDIVLLDTSRKLELITDTTYKKLRHMLDMRNDIGISHPTEYAISAFELLSYLETGVAVLNDQPSDAAIQVQSFIQNLKNRTDPLDASTAATIASRISELPSHLCGSLLRTVFGIYVDPKTSVEVRKNVAVVSKHIWNACTDEPKFKLGFVLEGYRTNLHQAKYELGEQFFENVGGNAFRSESERAVILDEALNELYVKHHGWDNFHHEVPIARKINSFIDDQNSIPNSLSKRLFETVFSCRVGNGVGYNQGVSPGARPYYNAILNLAGDLHGKTILNKVWEMTKSGLFKNENRRKQAVNALAEARKNAINERLLECYDYLIERLPENPSVADSKEFTEIAKSYFQE